MLQHRYTIMCLILFVKTTVLGQSMHILSVAASFLFSCDVMFGDWLGHFVSMHIGQVAPDPTAIRMYRNTGVRICLAFAHGELF